MPPQQATSSTTTPANDDLTQRDKKLIPQSALRASIGSLQSQITETESQIAQTKAKLKYGTKQIHDPLIHSIMRAIDLKSPILTLTSSNDPSTTVKRHIRLLHEYNEIKDIAQGLMGLIADARGVRQVDVQREYGLDDRD
ncbi:hypothetical protein AbraIFM66950_005452 [Aspergillus brasiliensis]|nr:hypothetical protein AbraIFM66950_005452 [Aspergillus brasiliensis]